MLFDVSETYDNIYLSFLKPSKQGIKQFSSLSKAYFRVIKLSASDSAGTFWLWANQLNLAGQTHLSSLLFLLSIRYTTVPMLISFDHPYTHNCSSSIAILGLLLVWFFSSRSFRVSDSCFNMRDLYKPFGNTSSPCLCFPLWAAKE